MEIKTIDELTFKRSENALLWIPDEERHKIMTQVPVSNDMMKFTRYVLEKSGRAIARMTNRQEGTSIAGMRTSASNLMHIMMNITREMRRFPSLFFILNQFRQHRHETCAHSINVALLTIHFSRYLGWPPTDLPVAGMAGLLHDLGKNEVSAAILRAPRPLTDEEWSIMHCHPSWGYSMLCHCPALPNEVLLGIIEHHERMDGKGYPLKKHEISEMGKIVALTDVFDAISRPRPYKEALSYAQTLDIMQQSIGHFDPSLLQKFSECINYVYTAETPDEIAEM